LFCVALLKQNDMFDELSQPGNWKLMLLSLLHC